MDVEPLEMPDFDYALVGGGLQNGLIALAVRARQPAARIAMIERGSAAGGNHTWCFHAGDVHDASWLEPLVVVRWPGYDVAFPDVRRRLYEPYACVSPARLAETAARATARPGSALLVGRCGSRCGSTAWCSGGSAVSSGIASSSGSTGCPRR